MRARGAGCADAVMIADCRLLPSVAGGGVAGADAVRSDHLRWDDIGIIITIIMA